MKAVLITGTLCAIVGFATGWNKATERYEAKAKKEQAAYSKALAEVGQRAWDYQKISEEYYEQYQSAISREPVTVTERVYVRADCEADATADSGRELGNGEAGQRAELHREVVASATAVTDQAERDVLSCRAALHSLQSKIIKHNELQR